MALTLSTIARTTPIYIKLGALLLLAAWLNFVKRSDSMFALLFVASAQAFFTGVVNATAVQAPDAQCKTESYLFCCKIGTPCDCTKPRTAPGQCSGDIKGVTSYAFCCDVGTPCDCTQPGLLGD